MVTLFFSIIPFDPPENIRKTKGFLMFLGGSKVNIGKKRVKDHKSQNPVRMRGFELNVLHTMNLLKTQSNKS